MLNNLLNTVMFTVLNAVSSENGMNALNEMTRNERLIKSLQFLIIGMLAIFIVIGAIVISVKIVSWAIEKAEKSKAEKNSEE